MVQDKEGETLDKQLLLKVMDNTCWEDVETFDALADTVVVEDEEEGRLDGWMWFEFKFVYSMGEVNPLYLNLKR